MPSHPITRRQFLASSTAAILSPAIVTRVPSKRVVIIGAGLAGLVAGLELVNRGHEVTILEARNRAGGRVLTIHKPFADGLYAEAGALFIPDCHHLTMKYARPCGLT